MTSRVCHYISVFDGFKVMTLEYNPSRDYKNCRSLSMYLLLPDAIDGFPALAERVCSESGFLDGHLKWKQVGLFLIPKFKISREFEASGVLQKLGLPADSIAIMHDAVIEVNEDGTIAVAATVAQTYRVFTPLPEEREDFVADHPFMFLIRQGYGTVLFMGHVRNPLTG